MKNRLPAFLAAISISVWTVCAWGQEAPVVVTHNLTGYSQGEKTVTLEYAVQVQNPGNLSLGSLSLTLVPHPPMLTKKTKVTVGKLGPDATANITVKLETRLLLDKGYFSKKPLFWAGKYTAADGKIVEFPVKSQPGGAK